MILETLLFTAGVTLPVCVMLVAGLILKKTGFIDDHFITVSSRLVFNFGLPAVIFFSLSNLGRDTDIDYRLILFALLSILFSFMASWLLSLKTVSSWRDRGVFIQGASRGNLAIIGLALVDNMYGDAGLAMMSVLIAFTVPLLNVLSVTVLSYYSKDSGSHFSLWQLLVDIVRNPLIIAVFCGAAFGFSGFELPGVVDSVGRYFAQITLPLALLGIGGTLSLDALMKTSRASFWAALNKTVVLPLLFIPVAWLMGFGEMELGVLFLMVSCPTAAASFVMTQSFGLNAKLAANIIVLTTLGAMPAVSLGLFVMRVTGVV
ncbi:MAG: AEC family transporter [Endozoicomonas sp.]